MAVKQRVEVRSQVEFDACVAAGNLAIVIGCRVVARGNSSVVARENSSVEARGNSSVVAWGNSSVVARENSSVEAWGNSSVVAWGNSSVVARDNSSVEAWDNSSVVAWDNSSVVARENSSVEAWDNSSVEAWDNSSVVARGNSSVEAWDNSSVEARENSSVEAWGNAFIRLFSALLIKASAYVTIVIHGHCGNITGGRHLAAAPEPKTGAEWCECHGIDAATAPYKVPSLDNAIWSRVESNPSRLDMSSWHGGACDESNWCETTHCRAGFAICLAGPAGFALEKKYGPRMAGQMIYAVSCPDQPLPNFTASDEDAIEDIRRRAAMEATRP